MTIDRSGNVGIGTPNPANKLDLGIMSQVGTGAVNLHNIMFEDNGNDHYSRIKMTGGNTYGYIYFNPDGVDGIHMGYNAYKENGNSTIG